MTIGTRIRNARQQKGFTQEYLAQQLCVSRQAVSKWEKDQTAPDTKNLIALADLLGVTVAYLASGADPVQSRTQKTDPLPFRRLSRLFFCPGVLLYLYGVFSGVFNRMVMVPITSEGDAIGVPFLYYGTSELAHGLLLGTLLCLLMAFLFQIIGYYLSR